MGLCGGRKRKPGTKETSYNKKGNWESVYKVLQGALYGRSSSVEELEKPEESWNRWSREVVNSV